MTAFAPPVITFDGLSDALASDYLPGQLAVRIGGQTLDAHEAHTSHGVNVKVGTGTVVIAAPAPAAVDYAAEVEILAGYPGATARIFHGFIPKKRGAISEEGCFVTVDATGWEALLYRKIAGGIEFPGPITLKELFRSSCAYAHIPNSLADETTDIDGNPILLGGNPQVDGGKVRLNERTSPGELLARTSELFGYRVYGTPSGIVRLSRVSGLPAVNHLSPDLTVDLVDGDDVEARTTVNVRSGPGTSFAIVGIVALGERGRITSSTKISANGFDWLPIDPLGQPSGWVAIDNSLGDPNFYRITLSPQPWRFAEGDNCFGLLQSQDTTPMITYVEVKGASFTDVDGGRTVIHSIPDTVPYAPELDPLGTGEQGYQQGEFSDSILVNDTLAQQCRNAMEVDRSEPLVTESWQTIGNPEAAPGDIANLHSTNLPVLHSDRWLMRVDHDLDSEAFLTTMEGWAGTGTPLPAGDDCKRVAVGGDAVIHFGDQTLSHYRDPSPDGIAITVPITVTDADYSSLRLFGSGHGTNSINTNTATTGSKVEVWQLPDPSLPESGTNAIRRVGSADFPSLDEELSRKRDYASSDRYWSAFSLPLPGTLKVGPAELRIISGELEGGAHDDGELKDLELEYCGVGDPDLPDTIEP